jgi:Fe-S cluster assembly iron-binding protein IscA
MVTLTDHAATAIRAITDNADVPEGAGLRIASDVAAGSLTVTVSPTPAAGDAVVESSGARLFLDEDAATALDDKALDASTDADGQVMFTVADQPG